MVLSVCPPHHLMIIVEIGLWALVVVYGSVSTCPQTLAASSRGPTARRPFVASLCFAEDIGGDGLSVGRGVRVDVRALPLRWYFVVDAGVPVPKVEQYAMVLSRLPVVAA